MPFAIETTGGWGEPFTKRFKDWVKQQREELDHEGGAWAATIHMQRWQQQISKALYESLAQRITAAYRPRNTGALGGG